MFLKNKGMECYRYSVWQSHTRSTECFNRYSPPRNGGYDDDTNQQPVGLQQGTGLSRIVAALQAALDGGVPLTQGVATGLYLFQPVGLHLRQNRNISRRAALSKLMTIITTIL